MFWDTLGAARDIGRLNDIASILIRYGFGDLVYRLGLAGVLERAGKALHWQQASELALFEPPARFRHALEEMGPTFIKLGQILSTRVDLFSSEWIAEFEKLQDQAPLIKFEAICQQLQEDLGASPLQLFLELDPEPLAAASIAQVHRARLQDGTAVVIKVRRPGIEPTMEADLRLLARMAELIEIESAAMRRFKPREIVRQFTLSLRRELDLKAECRNAERIAKNFSDHPEIVIPKVYWQWCSERVNVQQYIEGIPGRDLEQVDQAGLDRKILARYGAQAALKMVLDDGFFHADPHQGNIFYLPENRIAFIDFGMVGRLPEARRTQVVTLLHCMVEKDTQGVVEVLLDWAGDSRIDIGSLNFEIDGFIDQYHGVPLKDIDLGTMLAELTALMREYALSMPVELVLLIKALITLNGVARQLDPDLNMVAEASPFLQRAMQARYTPDALVKRSWKTLGNTLELLIGLPQDLRQLLRSARSGRFQLHVDVTRLKSFGNQLDRAASRIALGNVIAALIIGSAIVMTIKGGPTLFGLPMFGILGFIAAALGGIWLMFSIWHSGRGQ